MSSAAVDLLIRATMIAAAGWLATVVLRRRSASLRALIWTTTLGGLLVLPALSEIAPPGASKSGAHRRPRRSRPSRRRQ